MTDIGVARTRNGEVWFRTLDPMDHAVWFDHMTDFVDYLTRKFGDFVLDVKPLQPDNKEVQLDIYKRPF